MWNRWFVIFLTVVSIGWIGYVSVDLFFQHDRITPEYIFTPSDQSVWIFNRTSEIDETQLDIKTTPSNQRLLAQLTQTNSKHRIYFSQKRARILVENTSIWTSKSVETWLKSLNLPIQKKGSTWKLDNGYSVRFKQNFMVFFQGELDTQAPDEDFPSWDKKASANQLVHSKKWKAIDIYFNPDGSISFESKFKTDLRGKKVDDEVLFSEVLPAKLKNYHFYEREFALFSAVYSEKSPLFQWAETGFVTFDFQGETCLLSDYIGNQDPLVVLRELTNQEDALGNEFKSISLTKQFPSGNSFYAFYLGDKVLFTEQKVIGEKIVGAYQLGKTLALDPAAIALHYGKLPQKVSERFVSDEKSFTRSVYKNVLIKTVVTNKKSIEETPEVEEQPEEESEYSTAIEGIVDHVLGRAGQQFVITDDNTIIALANKDQRWKLKFEGEIIGSPQLIDLDGNGEKSLLFTTATQLFLVRASGAYFPGFPIQLEENATNSATFYRTNRGANFLWMNTKNQLIQADAKGKIIYRMRMNLSDVTSPIVVFQQNRKSIAFVSNGSKSQTVNLGNHRVLKTRNALPTTGVYLTFPDGPSYFFFENGALKRSDYTGSTVTLANYPTPDLFQICEDANTRFIAFNSYNKLHVLNENGVKITQIEIPFRKLESFDVITTSSGKTYIALVDALENNVYLFDKSGNMLLDKPLEGKGKVLLSSENGKLNVTVSLTGYLVQYFDVLK